MWGGAATVIQGKCQGRAVSDNSEIETEKAKVCMGARREKGRVIEKTDCDVQPLGRVTKSAERKEGAMEPCVGESVKCRRRIENLEDLP